MISRARSGARAHLAERRGSSLRRSRRDPSQYQKMGMATACSACCASSETRPESFRDGKNGAAVARMIHASQHGGG